MCNHSEVVDYLNYKMNTPRTANHNENGPKRMKWKKAPGRKDNELDRRRNQQIDGLVCIIAVYSIPFVKFYRREWKEMNTFGLVFSDFGPSIVKLHVCFFSCIQLMFDVQKKIKRTIMIAWDVLIECKMLITSKHKNTYTLCFECLTSSFLCRGFSAWICSSKNQWKMHRIILFLCRYAYIHCYLSLDPFSAWRLHLFRFECFYHSATRNSEFRTHKAFRT